MEKFEDNLTFEDIINQTLKKVKVGSTITGTIVEINGKGEIFVDIGYKADGIIPRNEYFSEKGLEPADEYKVGDKIKADVLKLNDGQGNVLMSCKHAKIKEIRKEFKEKVDNKEVFEEEVKQTNKNGLVVLYKNLIRVFIPISLSEVGRDEDISSSKGKTIRFRVIENDERAKKIIGSVKDLVEEEKKAKEEEAVMIIFPEYFMNYYPDAEHNYTKKAQSLHGEFVQAMKMLAKEFKMWIIFGMNEQTVDETKNYNTMVILNDLGELVSDYKKTHLFNAYKWNESMNTLKGDCLFTPIKTPAGVIGLGICYDLRFPELARYEALSGTQVMLYPAAWVKGKGKFMQWETLLRARAIENEMYVLGCCHYSKEHYMGRSTGFAPDGTRLYLGEEKEELLYAQIDKEQIQNIRTANPVFENRRKDLYD